jgi:transposase
MRTRSLLTPPQRELTVSLFTQHYGPKSVATGLNVSHRRVERLYDRWRIHGRLCLVEKPTKTQYSFEIKKEVVTRFLAGESRAELALEFQLNSPAVVSVWARK